MTITARLKSLKGQDRRPGFIRLAASWPSSGCGKAILLLAMVVTAACATSSVEKNLPPDQTEFLSQVRYLISREEKNTFLHLPDSERPRFIEEFWKRRDPDPETEENEFKVEYFKRMEKANELFLGEGKPGWLTERGRIYILFGPPSERIPSPASSRFAGRCQELWYYGDFPVLFVDVNCTGSFTLATIDLSHLNELNLALADAQKAVRAGGRQSFLDFSLNLKKKKDGGDRVEGLVLIEIPYRFIWLSAEGERLKTTLELSLRIQDGHGALLWEFRQSYELALTQAELSTYQDKKYSLEIPFLIERKPEELREGKSKLEVVLRNLTGKEEVRKTAEFSL